MFKFAVLAVALLAGVNGQATAEAAASATTTGGGSASANAVATATSAAIPLPTPVPHPIFYKKYDKPSPSPKPMVYKKKEDPKPKDVSIVIVGNDKKKEDKVDDIILVVEGDDNKKETEPTCSTVAATAAATPELSTLVAALGAAGLVEALDDVALVATILAPTNAAFEKLFEAFGATAEQVLADPQLANILLYHVIGGAKALSTDLVDGAELTTLVGQALIVDLSDGVTFIGEGSEASVVAADIEACEAVVHVIDNVLLPDFAALTTESAALPEEPVVEATASAEATVTLNI
eukprot:TRINITY_DN270_c0_g1_i2.p2 TRINITY_DN270_c0_g1~~TRINITY_DN270_c0_g1_i2.p2  ORF type:complete len:293 (-),score=121.04 TRINITY_DN270_c0_g1_i2:140-1018(-)